MKQAGSKQKSFYKSGFLLAEAFISLALFCLGFLAFSEALWTSRRVNRSAQESRLAIDCLEEHVLQEMTHASLASSKCGDVHVTEQSWVMAPLLIRKRWTLADSHETNKEIIETVESAR